MEKIKEMSIDLETYSDVDIKKSGVYKYAESENFEILLFAVSINGDDVIVYDLACGDVLPDEILDAIVSDDVIKWAFNASFERIHNPAFDGVVFSDLVYPFTELYRTLGIDLEAYSNDHLKAIVLGIACDLTRTFGLNYPEIPDS